MGIVEQYLLQLKIEKRRWRRAAAILTVLSLLVAVGVSWNLRMTGITLANDACCGYEEHQHTETCSQSEKLCEYEEHIHSIACYSDPNADVEDALIWQEMFAGYPYTGDLHQDLVGIAKTQVGYVESKLNFEADSGGARNGYTRYGAWYGAPYNEWSAMFVSFCLNYAGADLTEYPINSGANTMAGLWNALGKFAPSGQYDPVSGDLAFFKNNTVGIVSEVQNATVYVISGDVDDTVSGRIVPINDEFIDGWGVIGNILPGESESKESEPEKTEPEEAESVESEPEETEPEEAESVESEPEETESEESEPEEAELKEPEETESVELESEENELEEIEPEEVESEEPEPEEIESEELIPEETLSSEDLFDISEGPAVFIFEGEYIQSRMMQPYSIRNARTITDLLAYLNANEGSYFFTLMDNNNVELPKDENGNYIAQANSDYKLSISFNSPQGFLPGTYQYQIPNGLMVRGGEDRFILKDDTDVGSWVVTDTGLITLVFNENINDRTDITISVALGIRFPEQEYPIDFDGKITVTVEKPPEQQFPTKMYKWGVQGSKTGKEGDDPAKIYWTVQIVGQKDSQIPGNILSDQVLFGEWSKDHRYTESDIAGGLTFGVSEPDPVTGEARDWHSWKVAADDPYLIWTETGWSYKMPKTVICQWCGEVELGNENWVYTVNYTSTPDQINAAGTYGYENQASIDGQHAYAWTDFTHSEIYGEIIKRGAFISDASGGAFLWEVQAVIPGMKQGQKADYHWYIMDYMYLLNKEAEREGYIENDANHATVTVDYQGATIQVPRIQDATDEDLYAWDNAWTATENNVGFGREINLLYRCHCNESNCQFWNGKCAEYSFWRDDGVWDSNGFCQCWTVDEDVIFTFIYKTEALPVIQDYGGLGYQLQNVAELYFKPIAAGESALVSGTHKEVSIPGVFKKELTKDFNGYTAHYQITVNEAKAVLTNGDPLTIHDMMTDTLAYISGSMVIAAEDVNGNTTVLQQGKDYTLEYDGTGDQTDQAGNKVHVLDIVILKPQPVMYILDYDTTLIMPEQVTGAIKYSNSATITLWGESLTNDSTEKVYADINIAAKNYKVEMFKTCAQTGEPLANAVFGLYNAQGGLITTDTTDGNGYLLFQTNIIEGIVLREHVLYYIQEIKSPPAYQLDDTKHWFVFCNSASDSCETCRALIGGVDAIRIPFEQIGKVHVVNQPVNCELPSTGGIGVIFYILCGLILISAPLVYGLSLRRKYERRSRE